MDRLLRFEIIPLFYDFLAMPLKNHQLQITGLPLALDILSTRIKSGVAVAADLHPPDKAYRVEVTCFRL